MSTTKNPTIKNKNEAWILHREEIETIKDGTCNIYALIDAATGYCFGHEGCADMPNSANILNLMMLAQSQSKMWPQKIVVSKTDPYAEVFEIVCKGLKILFEVRTAKEILPYVKAFKDSFREFKNGGPGRAGTGSNSSQNSDQSQKRISYEEHEEIQAFIPDSYSPCSCASGKKFKFCCQKIFKDIAFAMAAAEDNNLPTALKYMQIAEEKVGRTAEIVCRTAICWSYYDMTQSRLFLAEALELNPNHPRANYICGIEAKAAKDYEQAILFYQTAIDNYPVEDKFHLNETYNNIGTAYYELKKYQQAKDSWEKALVFWPTDKMVIRNLFDFIYENLDLSKSLREISPFIAKFLKR